MLLIKGQTDNDGTTTRRMDGRAAAAVVERLENRFYTRRVARRGARRWRGAGAACARPSDLPPTPRTGRPRARETFVTGRHLSRGGGGGGCGGGDGGRLTPAASRAAGLLLNCEKPTDVFEKFAEKLPTLSDSCALAYY